MKIPNLFNILRRKPKHLYQRNNRQSVLIQDGWQQEYFDGSKFYNGFGPTKNYVVDYWTLRARSAQLFKDNIYARGLLRRLITNEINTGLCPEAIPNAQILGIDEQKLSDWAELAEDRFALWAEDKNLCDTTRQNDFSELQRIIRLESLASGDVLLILRLDRMTGLPRLQIIPGSAVQTPIGNTTTVPNNRIVDGVELNQFNQHVAYWILQEDGQPMRIDARGAASGRQIAWLVYGTDKRHGEVRGEPLLSIILQSLKEIDRYRDSTQRKATINAMLAIFMRKTKDKISSKSVTVGAVTRRTINYADPNQQNETRQYNIANQIPGLVLEDLQEGEEPVGFGNQGIDTSFAEFESAMIHAISWANEIPPEILQLAFSNNYSASQAAINEFKMYLNKIRSKFGAAVCKPIYQEWLISEVLADRIQADGFLEAWQDPLQFDIYNAWVATDWSGAIKPSTDIRKQAQGYQLMLANGLITYARASRELTGLKFSRIIRQLSREREALLEAGFELPSAPDPVKREEQASETAEEVENGQ